MEIQHVHNVSKPDELEINRFKNDRKMAATQKILSCPTKKFASQ